MKKLFFALVGMIILCSAHVFSQGANNKFVMEFQDGNAKKQFEIQGFSYGLSKSSYDASGSESPSQYLYVNFSLDMGTDKSLIQWVSDPSMFKDIKISMINKKTNKAEREFLLKKSTITALSESYYSYGGTEPEEGEASAPGVNVSISCEQFVIDGISIKVSSQY